MCMTWSHLGYQLLLCESLNAHQLVELTFAKTLATGHRVLHGESSAHDQPYSAQDAVHVLQVWVWCVCGVCRSVLYMLLLMCGGCEGCVCVCVAHTHVYPSPPLNTHTHLSTNTSTNTHTHLCHHAGGRSVIVNQ